MGTDIMLTIPKLCPKQNLIVVSLILLSTFCFAEKPPANTKSKVREVKYFTSDVSIRQQLGQDKELQEQVELLVQTDDSFNEKVLLEVRAGIENIIKQRNKQTSFLVYYYLANTEMSVFNQYDLSGDHTKSKKYLDYAIASLQQCLSQNDKFAEAHSYLGSLYERKISTETKISVVMEYSSLGIKEHRIAFKLDATNPIVLVNLGIHYLYTPTEYGGSKKKTKSCFEQSIKYCPTFTEGYIWLAIYYDQVDKNKKMAVELCQKAVSLNPTSIWAQSKLKEFNKETQK